MSSMINLKHENNHFETSLSRQILEVVSDNIRIRERNRYLENHVRTLCS